MFFDDIGDGLIGDIIFDGDGKVALREVEARELFHAEEAALEFENFRKFDFGHEDRAGDVEILENERVQFSEVANDLGIVS